MNIPTEPRRSSPTAQGAFASVDPANIPCRVSGAIGRDTAQVLEALGYSLEKIAAMYEAKEIR